MREVGARFSRTLPARGAQRQYERRYAQAVEHFETEWGGVLPASSESVVRYLAAYGAQLSSNTLRTHLAALAQWQQQYGFDDPTKASRVRDVLRGIQALHPQPRIELQFSNRPVDLAREKGAFPKFDARGYLAEGTFASRLPESLKAAIHQHGIPDEFPQKAIDEAEAASHDASRSARKSLPHQYRPLLSG